MRCLRLLQCLRKCSDNEILYSTQPLKPQASSSVPKHLTVTAEVVIPRLLWRLVLHFRTNYTPIVLKFDPMVISDVSPLLDLFDRLSKLGGVLRRVIVGALLDSDIYAKLMQASWPNRDSRKSIHQVLNCDSKILKDQCYWPIVSDFSNILSHQSVASYFFKDRLLMQLWSRFLTLFMGMNLNKRELGYHVEFEPNSYSTAFAAEIEGCAAPMWQIASHCHDKTTMLYTVALTKELQTALILWLENLNMGESLHPLQVSFHIPLIRYLSVFLKQGINEQGMTLPMLIRSPGRLRKLMMFPLQIMAAVNEVFCGMWVRNGLQMRCQAMTYLQCHFCASMADLDLYFLQVCAAMLEPAGFPVDEFIKVIFERFKVWKFVTFDPSHEPCNMDTNQEMSMLECLNFIATLVSVRTNLGMSADETLRLEMVTLLCMDDRTYNLTIPTMPHKRNNDYPTLVVKLDPNAPSTTLSQQTWPMSLFEVLFVVDSVNTFLVSLMPPYIPEKTGVINTNCKFEKTLKEIADYQLPTSDLGGLQQGKYSPKPEIWEKEFDPIHVMFRSMERKEFQSAMNNYTTYLNKSGKYKDKKLPWPPFQPLKSIHKEYKPLRKILNCRALHGLLYSLLYKAVHGSNMSETAVYMTIALINMALQCAPGEEEEGRQRSCTPTVWSISTMAILLGCLEARLTKKANPFEKEKVLHGQGPDYIKNVLDKAFAASPVCREVLKAICKRNSAAGGDQAGSCEGSPEAHEIRKKRSMEAKRRMIAKLAQQQKQFLESAFSEGMDSMMEMDGAASRTEEELPEYECVICSQVEPSTEDNPYGMCVLLQTTKVLGHRSQSDEPETLPLAEDQKLHSNKMKCYQLEASRWADATARFEKSSCLSSFSFNWEAGIHIQTCGHYVHIKCLKSFTESIGAHDLQARHLQVNAGEYECPICRQLANTILPCSLPRQPTSMAKYTCSNLAKLSLQISKRLGSATRQLNLGKNEFEMGVFKFTEDVFRQLTMELRKAARADAGGPFAYFCSLARTNIELYLVKRGGTLCRTKPDKSAEREPFLGLLLEIFSYYLDKGPKIPLHNTWQKVTGQYKPSKSDPEGTVPVLVQDPITLLFLLVYHLPQPITNDHLRCVILALYNLVHVQALTRIACKMSASDKHSYLIPAETSRQSEMSVLLGHIIQHLTHLRQSWLYVDIFGNEESPEAEFPSLLCYLHLSSSPSAEIQTHKFSMHSSQSMEIAQGNPLALIRSWCEEFNQFLLKCYAAEKSIRVPKSMIMFSPVFNCPRLIRLPKEYSQVFEFYRRQVCRKCSTKPRKPMICLVCGKLVCWASDCCVLFKHSKKFGEGIAHARDCGSLAAIYLDVDSSLTVLVQGQRLCRWASLYLDSHGEEDRGLRRGKPLYLCQERFDLLEKLWQSVKLKHFCKGWEWHLGGHE
ncbi:putative E3 ubiquitin-protein ligase UBR3 [Apostichopus japonicus]|uniref:E3 ubiquitin-protein ligase n=1 Tax=Stichopus japonicus TaxID=307972 RepID=A0A2G8KNJ4_STIJA|nr:putative E3 ubiquitin-protein ligase UBR3 [Apostichopus japonicus]